MPPGWEDYLDPGERILWQGHPDGAVIWSDAASPRLVMGILFALFGLAWMAGLLDAAGDVPFPFALVPMVFSLVGLGLVCLGVYLAVGRLYVEARQRAATHYTLTDRRAFFALDWRGRRRLELFPLAAMRPSLESGLEEDAPGTVWLGERIVQGSSGPRHGAWPPSSELHQRVGFQRIRDAPGVYRILRDLIHAMEGSEEPMV